MDFKEIHFDEIDSTSTYIKNNFDKIDQFTFVSASYQSCGRGRNSRVWVSNKNENLMFSFSIKDESLFKLYKNISLLSSYILAVTINEFFDVKKTSIKWPNDVYIDGCKIGGILLESHMLDDKIDGIIIGIGVNLNQIVFPSDLKYPVSSLKIIFSKNVDIQQFKRIFFNNILKYFEKLKENSFTDYITFARENNYLKDKEVYATINNYKKKVKVLDINDDCSLKMLIDNDIVSIFSGEITFH